MKNLFNPTDAAEIQHRLTHLTPSSRALWGTMNVLQAVAHCNAAMDMTTGDLRTRSAALPARLLGRLIKPLVVENDKPFRRNSPSAPELFDPPQDDLGRLIAGLHDRIERFTSAGESACTRNPHPFFGPLTPGQWSVLAYKHLDHHLRQFGF